MKPLADLLHLQSDTIASELSVGVNLLRKKLPSESSLETAYKEVFLFKDPFPNVYSSLTIGVSAATCENNFSSVTSSMSHERKALLVLLAFEKYLTQRIDLDKFVMILNTKSRWIIL